ncbi:hypothetical protein ACFFGQ_15895 [Rufibacter quisquiliarum]
MKQLRLVSPPRREGSQRPPIISRHESGDSRQRVSIEGTEVSSAP